MAWGGGAGAAAACGGAGAGSGGRRVRDRQAGGLEGYPYSPALQKSDIIWNSATINRLFAEGPDKVTPGTKMPIQSIGENQ